jgi:hypothetical protein
MKPKPEIVYLTGPQVRARYGITKVTLCRWIKRESWAVPPPWAFGTRLFFKLNDLEAWERARAADNTKKAA